MREFARVADSRFAVLGEPAAMQVDVLIFGGGAAGLWLLDELARRGDRVLLLEAARLGAGQTIASQGIIHGGLKYTLQGALTPSAVQIREMPGLWRDCLAGRRLPDLRNVRLRAACLSFVADRFARFAAGDDRGPRRPAGRPSSRLR